MWTLKTNPPTKVYLLSPSTERVRTHKPVRPVVRSKMFEKSEDEDRWILERRMKESSSSSDNGENHSHSGPAI